MSKGADPNEQTRVLLLTAEEGLTALIQRVLNVVWSSPSIHLCRELDRIPHALPGGDTQEASFDLVILDLALADGDGCFAISTIRRRIANSRTAVVAVAGSAVPDRQERSLQRAGADLVVAADALWLRAADIASFVVDNWMIIDCRCDRAAMGQCRHCRGRHPDERP